MNRDNENTSFVCQSTSKAIILIKKKLGNKPVLIIKPNNCITN